jgi:hypothetical protein
MRGFGLRISSHALDTPTLTLPLKGEGISKGGIGGAH